MAVAGTEDAFARPGDILNTALRWREEGREVALATVVSTWGSSPRPVGSHLVIDADGSFEGSVSGGCVEGAVIRAARHVIATGERADAGVWRDRRRGLGSRSGLRRTDRGSGGARRVNAPLLRALRESLSRSRAVVLVRPIEKGPQFLVDHSRRNRLWNRRRWRAAHCPGRIAGVLPRRSGQGRCASSGGGAGPLSDTAYCPSATPDSRRRRAYRAEADSHGATGGLSRAAAGPQGGVCDRTTVPRRGNQSRLAPAGDAVAGSGCTYCPWSP